MVCIHCTNPLSVSNSRAQRRSNQVWRRRNCTKCQATFTTHERIDLRKSLAVRGTNGRLTPFIREKLLVSILKSCQHRADALDDTIGLTESLINQLCSAAKDGLVDVEQIVQACREVLSRFDNAAAVHYAAYHEAALH